MKKIFNYFLIILYYFSFFIEFIFYFVTSNINIRHVTLTSYVIGGEQLIFIFVVEDDRGGLSVFVIIRSKWCSEWNSASVLKIVLQRSLWPQPCLAG